MPLLHAVKAGNAGIVNLLLDAGASVHRRLTKDESDDWTDTEEMAETESALDLAATGGHVDVMKEIIRREPSCVISISTCTTLFHRFTLRRETQPIRCDGCSP